MVLPPAPEGVTIDNRRWRVRRAWPDGAESLSVEVESCGDRPHGRDVRAGYWDGAAFEIFAEGEDPGLPALAEVLRDSGGAVVSHRAGRRAVVRGAEGHYTKVVRRGRADRLVDSLTRASAFARSFAVPQVIGHTASTVEFAAVPGRGLHAAQEWADDQWQQAWDAVLASWEDAVGHTDPTGSCPGLAVHDAAAEARVLREWVTRAQTLSIGRRLEGAGARVERELLDLAAPATPTLIHRDLHDKQLLWIPEDGPGLLDLDTASLGDPALDLGNLRAHARLRELQHVWSPRRSAVVRETVDRCAARVGCTAGRLRGYERAALVRLACVYAFRPSWRWLAAHLITEGEAP